MSSTKPPQSTVARPDGRGPVTRLGIPNRRADDLYHFLLTASWPKLIGWIAVFYLTINLTFGFLYWIGGDVIAAARPGSFVDSFFFSVQTFATIGYGAMAPKTIYANVLVTIEAFTGMLSIAIAAGLMFSKFARPTARVLFSKVAVIARRDGMPALMVRMANQRSNMIVEANVRLSVLLTETTQEGETLRRLHDLALLRSSTPAFTLTFTAVHIVDEKSVLFPILTPKALQERDAQIFLTLVGTEEAFAQTVHARTIYRPSDVLFNARFVDILSTLRDGGSVVDYTRFNDVVPETGSAG